MHDRGRRLYQILRYVRPLTLASARVVEATLRDRGVTVGMRAVLEVLHTTGPAPVPEIARTLDLARQGVQRLVNELLERGYATSRPNPRHRRSPVISLTAAGSETFATIRADELHHLSGMAAGCTDAEIDTAIRVLAALDEDVRRRARALHTTPETT